MGLADVLELHGVDPSDERGVLELVARLPLAPESRVRWWRAYVRERGREPTAAEEDLLRAGAAAAVPPPTTP
ncbi:hypothetical protein HRbin32_01299 [bacterium HR32]|nr:hypothetical protein HRbin32_01299 [bacterium HR32]